MPRGSEASPSNEQLQRRRHDMLALGGSSAVALVRTVHISCALKLLGSLRGNDGGSARSASTFGAFGAIRCALKLGLLGGGEGGSAFARGGERGGVGSAAAAAARVSAMSARFHWFSITTSDLRLGGYV
jgi:hypothetical protein